MLKTRAGLFLVSFLSGLLLSFAWPSAGFAPLLFVALVPLLISEEGIREMNLKHPLREVFLHAYIAFFTFNLLTTWWVKYASFFGAVAAIVCNALFMALVFTLFSHTRKKLGNTSGYVALVAYWITFEYVHMNWDLSWPWLTLGNGFAGWVKWIQWYEFTGVLGGTLWIWAINILIFTTGRKLWTWPLSREVWILSSLLILPAFWSVYRYYNVTDKGDAVNVSVIQPNIDPYNEKFTGMSSSAQLDRILDLAYTVTDSTTHYVVAPETALPDGMWEHDIASHPNIRRLSSFLSEFPRSTWVIGATTYGHYPDSNQRSATARKFTESEGYYDAFNTALQVRLTDTISIHHKSKLVPGVEKMPYPALFGFLDRFAIDLGGITGSLGVQDTPSVFGGVANVAPVICYESVYGDYIGKYIRRDANLIFIVTNDGWWSDTPGYRQHLKYATLRAIEVRRSIARSANTGISCFINQRGDISQATGWWVPAAIKQTIYANDELTIYARLGDYIGKLAFWTACAFFGLSLTRRKGLDNQVGG
jgi:apolipoprotein N-acyltransferase